MIKLAPRINRPMSYDEAMLLCFCFEHDGYTGWRLPTAEEYTGNHRIWGWHQNDPRRDTPGQLLTLTPVRDFND